MESDVFSIITVSIHVLKIPLQRANKSDIDHFYYSKWHDIRKGRGTRFSINGQSKFIHFGMTVSPSAIRIEKNRFGKLMSKLTDENNDVMAQSANG